MVLLLSRQEWRQTCIVGVDCREGPPVPIPNTEVKLAGAEDTWLETARKNRFSPTLESSRPIGRLFFCREAPAGKSRGARCHSLHPEKNTGCLSAVAAPRASRGALVATRFTRSGTPAVCPRWLRWLRWLRHGQVAERSLPLASPGEKHWLSVREGWLGV